MKEVVQTRHDEEDDVVRKLTRSMAGDVAAAQPQNAKTDAVRCESLTLLPLMRPAGELFRRRGLC